MRANVGPGVGDGPEQPVALRIESPGGLQVAVRVGLGVEFHASVRPPLHPWSPLLQQVVVGLGGHRRRALDVRTKTTS